MTLALVPALTVTAAVTGTPLTPVAKGEHSGLLRAHAKTQLGSTEVYR